ncbi:MAG TPA: hypothetical protein DDY87_03910 [Clostridiales bacterium]|nr:hypothetical protein [Clostridiales bacterium]
MKRLIVVGLALAVVLGGVFYLQNTAIAPELYTGDWYRVEDGKRYHFQDGVIAPAEKPEEFAGAYTFCADKIVLFIKEPTGTSRICELYPGGEPRGEFLCEGSAEKGRIVFSRSSLEETQPGA